MKDESQLKDLRLLTDFMDRHFKGPFGTRFGYDGLIGMVPIVGDIVTNSISVYVILRAALLGCPASVILRMGINLFVENLIDIIPFFGNLFDFFWKANSKNLKLIDQHFADPRRTQVSSRFFVAFAVLVVILFVLASLALAVFALAYLLKEIPWN